MLKTKVIQEFLRLNTEADLAQLYTPEMEVQVNVAQDNGVKITGESHGKSWWGWQAADADGKTSGEVWKPIRIPWSAKSNPEYRDSDLVFSPKHFEGIGLTGWNYVTKKSVWVGFDFDAITNHKQGLSESELREIQEAVSKVEWVTVRKSTSGAGLHFYVFIQDSPFVPTHTDHAALARAILGVLSSRIGYKLESKVDGCGGILWMWHRRRKESGFTLIKSGVSLTTIPTNWQSHVPVIERKKSKIEFNGDMDVDLIAIKTKFRPLTDKHKNVLAWFMTHRDKLSWWDPDRHMFVCHTYDLKQCHTELCLAGIFETNSQGKDKGCDQNCFMHPMTTGWMVRRHTKGVKEAPSWDIDSSGWTRCTFDAPTNLGSASRSCGGSATSSGEFVFRSFDHAVNAIEKMGLNFTDVPVFAGRVTTISETENNKLVVSVQKQSNDPWVDGWAPSRSKWEITINQNEAVKEIETPDENCRHLVSNNSDAGWYFRARDTWIEESQNNITLALSSMGTSRNDARQVLGNCVVNYWTFTCEPFKPEYPGDRKWNRNAPQLATIPKPGEHPNWNKILEHVGEGLTECIEVSKWCKDNGVVSGADYLRFWIASLFQFPTHPLPYLFLYGEQNTGKSILHEAIKLLFYNGVGCVRADQAITSTGRYNAELHGAVLCVIEETDLKNQNEAYARIKDWVTGKTMLIHPKYGNPFDAPNFTHWIQTSNHKTACPTLPGDTRITMIRVTPPKQDIPKEKFLQLLRDESPYFLNTLLETEIPIADGRLRIPILTTFEKLEAQSANQDVVQLWCHAHLYQIDGHSVDVSKLYAAFASWLEEPLRKYWTCKRFISYLPDWCVRGRYSDGGLYHVANVSLEAGVTPNGKLVRRGDRLLNYDQAFNDDTARILAGLKPKPPLDNSQLKDGDQDFGKDLLKLKVTFSSNLDEQRKDDLLGGMKDGPI